MLLESWKTTALVLLTGWLMAAGAGGIALQMADEPQMDVTTTGETSKALRLHREAPEGEIKARAAGVDPERSLEWRIQNLLKNDPEVASLKKEIEQLQRRVDQADYQLRPPARTEPSVIHEARRLEALKEVLRVLIARKMEKLMAQGRDEAEGAVSLPG
jgi:hypothetical protein